MRTDKIADAVVNVINIAGYISLTAFMAFFIILAVLALALTFIEGDIFNLIGVGGCAFLAWVLWSVRREIL